MARNWRRLIVEDEMTRKQPEKIKCSCGQMINPRSVLASMTLLELAQLRKATLISNRKYPDHSNIEFVIAIDHELDKRSKKE